MTANEFAPLDLAALAERINAEHDKASAAFKSGFQHAVEAGQLLIEAKATVPHGGWLPWLTANCTVSERTAQLYMRISRGLPELEAKSATVADLTLNAAVKLLEAPETPQAGTDAEIALRELEGCATAIRHCSRVSAIQTTKLAEHIIMAREQFEDDGWEFEGWLRELIPDAFDGFMADLLDNPANSQELISALTANAEMMRRCGEMSRV